MRTIHQCKYHFSNTRTPLIKIGLFSYWQFFSELTANTPSPLSSAHSTTTRYIPAFKQNDCFSCCLGYCVTNVSSYVYIGQRSLVVVVNSNHECFWCQEPTCITGRRAGAEAARVWTEYWYYDWQRLETGCDGRGTTAVKPSSLPSSATIHTHKHTNTCTGTHLISSTPLQFGHMRQIHK